jgi:hypothetical protein
MTDTKLPKYDILAHCREQCANGACMSGDSCVQMMHDEPCYTDIADELTRLRAQNAALVEALKPFAEYGHTLLGQKVRDDGVMVELWDHKITVADMRKAARTALAQAESDT